MKSSDLVRDVFKRHGIGLVTLQPEFTLADLIGTLNTFLLKIKFHGNIS